MMDKIEPFERWVLFFVYLPGCEACAAAEVELEKFEKRLDAPMVIRLNAEAPSPHEMTRDVKATPTYILALNGEVVRKRSGVLKLNDLQRWTSEER